MLPTDDAYSGSKARRAPVCTRSRGGAIFSVVLLVVGGYALVGMMAGHSEPPRPPVGTKHVMSQGEASALAKSLAGPSAGIATGVSPTNPPLKPDGVFKPPLPEAKEGADFGLNSQQPVFHDASRKRHLPKPVMSKGEHKVFDSKPAGDVPPPTAPAPEPKSEVWGGGNATPTKVQAPAAQPPQEPLPPITPPTPPPSAPPSASRRAALPSLSADVERQAFVKGMFQHAWEGYSTYAWGKDTLRPVSKSADNNFLGMAATAVDAMDTLLIMGMVEEYAKAEDWVLTNLHFKDQKGVSVFETTIRVLGGLLAAYDLTDTLQETFGVDAPLSTNRKALLARAAECADALKFAFETPTGIPYGTVSLGAGKRAYNPSWTGGASSTAEAMTLQLEWEYLAKATGKPEYAQLVRRTMAAFHNSDPEDHLLRTRISPKDGSWRNSEVKLGANGDSAFEYLVKQWVWGAGWARPQSRHPWVGDLADMPDHQGGAGGDAAAWKGGLRGGKAVSGPNGAAGAALAVGPQAPTGEEGEYFDAIRSFYDKTVHGIKSHLVHLTTAPVHEPPLAFISERQGARISHKMDHLVCFAGGMLALGAESAWGAAPKPGWTREAYTGLHDQAAGGGDGASRAELLALQDEDDMRLAAELTRTCHDMYTMTPTGLAPEIVRFEEVAGGGLGMVVDRGAKHCLLRPEAVESFFIMYRLTGDEKYREWGWDVAQAIDKFTRIASGGFSSIADVTQIPVRFKDHQESFFLAETLKYLYLLFSDSSLIPLDKYVFNTEAHPLSILGSAAPEGA